MGFHGLPNERKGSTRLLFPRGPRGFNILRGMFRLHVSNLDELGESVTLVPTTFPQPPNKALFRVELPEDMNKVRLIEDSP